MLLKIKIHSAVDTITNSSSIIYNYQDKSVETVKVMINEFAKAFNIDKTADDMFYIGCFCPVDRYLEEEYNDNEENLEELNENGYDKIKTEKDVEKVIKNVLTGKIKKPEWMEYIENCEDYNGFLPESLLYLVPKSKEYKVLGEKIIKFINSSKQEATYE